MQKLKSVFHAATVTVCIFAFWGCGDQHSKLSSVTDSADANQALAAFANGSDTCQSGVDSFAQTVHPFVQQRCAACHNGSLPRAPAFAVPDVTASYTHIITRTNFDNIPNSTFVRVGGNMHCQAFGINCQTNFQDVTDVVTAWWDQGERDCPRKGKYFSDGVIVPANLPNVDGGFALMRFPLGSIDPMLANAFLELEAQNLKPTTESASGAYRFRAPRLVTPAKNLYINNVKVLVNGKFNPNANTYTHIDKTVAAKQVPSSGAPMPHPVLSSKPLIVGHDLPSGDLLTVSFEAIQEKQAVSCSAFETFKAKVMPVLAVRNCQTCHGGPGVVGRAPANLRFNMDVNDQSLCAAFLERADLRLPMNSPIIDLPLRGALQHPRIIPNINEVNPTWTQWIINERNANFK